MKRLLQIIFSASLVILSLGVNAYAQGDISHPRFLAKVDLLGLATLPSGTYSRLSPEFEYRSSSWKTLSLVADFEYFRAKATAANVELAQLLNTPEFYFGTETHVELSARIGLRKYFKVVDSPLSGFFAELQSGLSRKTLDTTYQVASHPPYRSEGLSIEARLRVGYQNSLSKHAWYSFLIETDPRRLISREQWYRVVWMELNIGFGK